MVNSSAERFGFECESTGTVEIDLGIIHKDFNIHGVRLQKGIGEDNTDAQEVL